MVVVGLIALIIAAALFQTLPGAWAYAAVPLGVLAWLLLCVGAHHGGIILLFPGLLAAGVAMWNCGHGLAAGITAVALIIVGGGPLLVMAAAAVFFRSFPEKK
jgi:hypothetical protein